ncbi:MAG TPA: helix-turn-helix transcriptional regulator [Phycisphaerales bacterium]|nr:helix-turn-helix transcriptional regulator [Phycisphaerales bacterium]
MKTVSMQLREAIERSGKSRYEIARQTGVNASVLSRFVASGRGLRSHNVDALCAYLGLTLVKVKTTGKARKGGA